ncbi:MAG: [protein-PII] uridylyltransferase [Planctomycetales bacterium]
METSISTSTDHHDRLAPWRAEVVRLRHSAWKSLDDGVASVRILEDLSDGVDRLVLEVLETNLAKLPPEVAQRIKNETAVLAVGGSGRGEVAPYSDLDLLFLSEAGVIPSYRETVSQFVRDIWDIGYKLGHSVRTIKDAINMSRQEPQFATSLVEARLLWGNPILLRRLEKTFYRQMIQGRLGTFIDLCTNARLSEIQPHGWTAQQLEPDVKNSPGTLRDLHLIRWVGYAKYRTKNVDELRIAEVINDEDAKSLNAAHEMLSHIRLELHKEAGKAQEILTRAEQVRIAEKWGFQQTPTQYPVEQFMQMYFRHTTAVSRIARWFVELQRPKSLATRCLQSVMAHRAHGIFKVGNTEIDASAARIRDHRLHQLEDVLKVFELAALYQVRLSPQLAELIRHKVPRIPAELTPEAIQSFMSILENSAYLGTTLREMYECGVLEKVIPEFKHTNCLLQFNQYHHYTVDEHTLRTIEEVCRFVSDPTSLGQAYRAVHNKGILHLALLLHDVGKGYEEDHSEVGARIARVVGERFGLSARHIEMLEFLVLKHLRMVHVAFRLNLADPETHIRFGREVGSQEKLRMLYCLSAADLKGVGPETWTSWKGDLLKELFEGTMSYLSNEQIDWQSETRLKGAREAILKLRRMSRDAKIQQMSESWIVDTLNTLPPNFLARCRSEDALETLSAIHHLPEGDVVVRGRQHRETHAIEYQVITSEKLAFGCFSKICGVLTAQHMEILSAQIITSMNNTILDSFHVLETSFSGQVPATRILEVSNLIREVLLGRQDVGRLLSRNNRFATTCRIPSLQTSTEVVIDNDSSARCTIIDIFALDQRGLLFLITCVLRELGLSVTFAKISTHLDQVVDVFYVTNDSGEKIRDEERLGTIKRILTERINLFQRGGQL